MTQEEIKQKFTVPQLLELLPAEIIKGRKNFFFADEVFDLAIRKCRVFNTWTVEYYNERNIRTFLQYQSTDLAKCLAEMVYALSELKYIQL
jgi:hypothetical protein